MHLTIKSLSCSIFSQDEKKRPKREEECTFSSFPPLMPKLLAFLISQREREGRIHSRRREGEKGISLFFRQGRAPMHPSSLLRLFSSPVLVPRPQMIFMSHFFC